MKEIQTVDLLMHDLNQLVVLSALLSHASVTQAADVLGVAQPTMSKYLARLRDTFKDPILVREGNVMHPTPFARDLAIKVQAALVHISEIYNPPRPFDPATISGVLKIGGNDYVQAVLGVPFMRRMRETAPLLNIEFRPVGSLYPEQLLTEGGCDIAISTNFPNMTLRHQSTFADPFVCVVDGANGDVPDRLDIDSFLALPQVDISPSGTGLLREMFARAQRRFKSERRIVATVTSFLVLPEFMRGTDIVALIPERAFDVFPAGALRKVALDFDLPAYEVSLWWHNKTHTDPLLQWARAELAATARGAAGDRR